MKLILIIAASLAALVLLIAVIGAFLPKAHQASRSAVIAAAPDDVYRTLTDFAAAPSWRPDVRRVELLGDNRFREHGLHGAVTYEVVQRTPGKLLVTRIADVDLGYSGSWTYELAREGAATRLTITERGEVSNVIFRFLSRFVFGHTKMMEAYLMHCRARFAPRSG